MPLRSSHMSPRLRRSLAVVVVGAASLSLGGCLEQLAVAGCAKMNPTELRVDAGQTCRFRFDGGETARYRVVVTQQPMHGEASGEGRYLRYSARPGFVGEDRVNIKIERRGIGHVQWENRTVRVKIGPSA